MKKPVEDILNDLEGPQDIASLNAVLGKSADRLGFQNYAYAALRMPQGLDRPFVITNYPEAGIVITPTTTMSRSTRS